MLKLRLKSMIAMLLVFGMIVGNIPCLMTTVLAEEWDNFENTQNYSVDFRIDNEWEQGYNATITITNTNEKTIDNWYLAFETTDEIQNLQSGTIIQHEGNQYLVKNAGWNKDIPVGGSVNFTFTALKSSENVDEPEGYSIDVVLLEVDAGRIASEFIVQSDWGDGFTGVLVIHNVSEEPILDWKLDFEFAGEISNLTGGDWINLGNGMYEVAEYSYDQGIPAGGAINIQFVGKRSDSTVVPTEIQMRTAEYWVEPNVPEVPEELPPVELDVSSQSEEIEKIKALNGGIFPEMYLDEEDGIPFFIDGKYSDVKVVDYDSAIQSLHDLTFIMYICWDEVSFEGVSTERNQDLIFYRLQELYCNMEVVGKQLIVVTDLEGNIVTLSGDFDPLYQLDTTQNVDVGTAKQTAESVLNQSVNDGKLVWYSLEPGYDEPAWYFESSNNGIYISAMYGDNLMTYPLYSYAGDDIVTREHVFSDEGEYYVEHNLQEERYYLRDSVRKIEVIDGNGRGYDNPEVLPVGNADISFDNSWSKAGSRTMSYVTKIYDYYLELVGLRGIDGNAASWIKVVYNSFTDDGEDNAEAKYLGQGNQGVISVCDGATPFISLDLISHEYAHLVEWAQLNLIYSGESGAIKEAFADCMSELMDCSFGDEAWANRYRDIAGRVKLNAAHDEMPVKLSDASYRTASDSQAWHGNSCLISHAVYRLYQEGFADADTMAKMMYWSVSYLPKNAKYINMRAALVTLAKQMGLDKTAVDRVFDDAEINLVSYSPGNGKITYNLYVFDDATGKPIENALVEVKQSLNKRKVWTDARGKVSLQIYNVHADINVSALGYGLQKVFYEFNGLQNEVVRLEADSSSGTETGQVMDGQNNAVLDHARIRIRQGINATCGRYLTDVNHQIIETYTDAKGRFTMPKLRCGVYTVEIVKDGYIVGYEDLVVRPKSEETQKQEIQKFYLIKKMRFDECRVVLTWNEDPKDLDTYLTCYDGDNYRYIVWYKNKRYKDEASLDIDATKGHGPETLTFEVKRQYKYKYSVLWYSGVGTWKTSGARVQVYSGNKKIADLYVDPEQKNSWEVFTVEDGKIYFDREREE